MARLSSRRRRRRRRRDAKTGITALVKIGKGSYRTWASPNELDTYSVPKLRRNLGRDWAKVGARIAAFLMTAPERASPDRCDWVDLNWIRTLAHASPTLSTFLLRSAAPVWGWWWHVRTGHKALCKNPLKAVANLHLGGCFLDYMKRKVPTDARARAALLRSLRRSGNMKIDLSKLDYACYVGIRFYAAKIALNQVEFDLDKHRKDKKLEILGREFEDAREAATRESDYEFGRRTLLRMGETLASANKSTEALRFRTYERPVADAAWYYRITALGDQHGPFSTSEMRFRFNRGNLQDSYVWIQAFPSRKWCIEDLVDAYGDAPFEELKAFEAQRDARRHHMAVLLSNRRADKDRKYAKVERRLKNDIETREKDLAHWSGERKRYLDLAARMVPYADAM